jgi:hypothetical protein
MTRLEQIILNSDFSNSKYIHIPHNSFLPDSFCTKLHSEYMIKYVFVGKDCFKDALPFNIIINQLKDLNITLTTFTNNMLDDYIDFEDIIFIQRFRSYYASLTKTERKFDISNYLKHQKPKGYFLKQNNQIKACILSNDYAPSPAIKENATHIGFVGYNRNSLKKIEAQTIKNMFKSYLLDNVCDTKLYTSTVNWFNKPSIDYHLKLGMRLNCLRIEKNK